MGSVLACDGACVTRGTSNASHGVSLALGLRMRVMKLARVVAGSGTAHALWRVENRTAHIFVAHREHNS